MKIGYVRVSSATQNPERQREALKAEGVEKVYEDFMSGKDNNREELQKLLAHLRADDLVIVSALDRLSRNYSGFQKIWQEIESKGAKLKIINMGVTLEHNNPMTQFTVGIMAQVAELERGMIEERRQEGIKLAMARGVYKGRAPDLELHSKVVKLLAKGITAVETCNIIGTSRPTVTRIKKKYRRPDGTYIDPYKYDGE